MWVLFHWRLYRWSDEKVPKRCQITHLCILSPLSLFQSLLWRNTQGHQWDAGAGHLNKCKTHSDFRPRHFCVASWKIFRDNFWSTSWSDSTKRTANSSCFFKSSRAVQKCWFKSKRKWNPFYVILWFLCKDRIILCRIGKWNWTLLLMKYSSAVVSTTGLWSSNHLSPHPTSAPTITCRYWAELWWCLQGTSESNSHYWAKLLQVAQW